MPKAVRFDDYGGVEVLEVRDVPRPQPGPGEVLVAVRAAGINPSEGKIRAGLVRAIFPATFPSGEGSDLAGVVEEVGAGVSGVAVGDEVIGFTDNRKATAAPPLQAQRPWRSWPRRSRPANLSSRSSAPIHSMRSGRRSPNSSPATSLGRSS
jgi:NADPH:quinone reductase-like Zn-dependent oxidoreductase